MTGLLDGARVLLVEDEADHAELIRRSFAAEAPGASVVSARSLREARARIEESPPTLLLSDLRLPDGEAMDFLPADGGEQAYPLVIMTGQGSEREAVEALKRGALDYVVKSGDAFMRMPGIVERALAEWRHRVERELIQNALQEANRELAEAYEATIEGWSRALDLRDRETEGHTRRVADLTVRLAVSCGMPPTQVVHVRRGAFLHDIGKMGVPDAILHKPGPLTDEEWTVMRLHPSYAWNMLNPIAYLRPALDIPWAHHERWDGTGYPRGLAGEDIPLAARLFSVIDVWDALRSDRPYRLAMPPEEVIRHLRARAGSHFEPRIVELFLDTIPG
jgi:putative two-component system response regulator